MEDFRTGPRLAGRHDTEMPVPLASYCSRETHSGGDFCMESIQRTVGSPLASKRVRSDRMARRPNAAVGVICPRCGMLAARIIGRSESLPVIYLQCEDCGRTSVAPSGEQA